MKKQEDKQTAGDILFDIAAAFICGMTMVAIMLVLTLAPMPFDRHNSVEASGDTPSGRVTTAVMETTQPAQTETTTEALTENIYSPADEEIIEPESEPLYILTEREKQLISVTAWNADHTSDESLACVIQTILNRTYRCDGFPDTVEAVLRQKKQFESCDKIIYNKAAYDYGYICEIIDKVCGGYDPFGGELVLYYSAEWVKPSQIARGLYLVRHEGGSKFYGKS